MRLAAVELSAKADTHLWACTGMHCSSSAFHHEPDMVCEDYQRIEEDNSKETLNDLYVLFTIPFG